MKRIAFAAISTAVAGLAACSHADAPTTAPASHHAVIVPVSCRHQYRAWAGSQGKGLVATLDSISSAEAAGNTRILTADLRKSRSAVAQAARHPVPACADPRGYWNVLLMHVTAATGSHGSAAVQAAMKDVPAITRELDSELKNTTR